MHRDQVRSPDQDPIVRTLSLLVAAPEVVRTVGCGILRLGVARPNTISSGRVFADRTMRLSYPNRLGRWPKIVVLGKRSRVERFFDVLSKNQPIISQNRPLKFVSPPLRGILEIDGSYLNVSRKRYTI